MGVPACIQTTVSKEHVCNTHIACPHNFKKVSAFGQQQLDGFKWVLSYGCQARQFRPNLVDKAMNRRLKLSFWPDQFFHGCRGESWLRSNATTKALLDEGVKVRQETECAPILD